MVERLKLIKRALAAWILRIKTRREAYIAFRYDMAQFMENAGTLHLDRKAAARAEIVMGYHVLEKGLTMPRRRLGFGKGVVLHLINLIKSFERRFERSPQSTQSDPHRPSGAPRGRRPQGLPRAAQGQSRPHAAPRCVPRGAQ